MIRELLEVALWLGLAVVIVAAAIGPLLGWYFQ
jgi:hypothetical protein